MPLLFVSWHEKEFLAHPLFYEFAEEEITFHGRLLHTKL